MSYFSCAIITWNSSNEEITGIKLGFDTRLTGYLVLSVEMWNDKSLLQCSVSISVTDAFQCHCLVFFSSSLLLLTCLGRWTAKSLVNRSFLRVAFPCLWRIFNCLRKYWNTRMVEGKLRLLRSMTVSSGKEVKQHSLLWL